MGRRGWRIRIFLKKGKKRSMLFTETDRGGMEELLRLLGISAEGMSGRDKI